MAGIDQSAFEDITGKYIDTDIKGILEHFSKLVQKNVEFISTTGERYSFTLDDPTDMIDINYDETFFTLIMGGLQVKQIDM